MPPLQIHVTVPLSACATHTFQSHVPLRNTHFSIARALPSTLLALHYSAFYGKKIVVLVYTVFRTNLCFLRFVMIVIGQQTADKSKIKILAIASCESTKLDIHNRPHTYTSHNVMYNPSFPIKIITSASLIKRNILSAHIPKTPYLYYETCESVIPLTYNNTYELPIISMIEKAGLT